MTTPFWVHDPPTAVPSCRAVTQASTKKSAAKTSQLEVSAKKKYHVYRLRPYTPYVLLGGAQASNYCTAANHFPKYPILEMSDENISTFVLSIQNRNNTMFSYGGSPSRETGTGPVATPTFPRRRCARKVATRTSSTPSRNSDFATPSTSRLTAR